MRITKRQLKRIIREEYSRLQRRGLIRESASLDPSLVEEVQWAIQSGGEEAALSVLESAGVSENEMEDYLAAGAEALAAYWSRYHESMGASYSSGRDSRWSGD